MYGTFMFLNGSQNMSLSVESIPAVTHNHVAISLIPMERNGCRWTMARKLSCSCFQYIFTARQRSGKREGNVSIRVCLSFCPQHGGSHVTITHDALVMGPYGPPPPIWRWDLRGPLLSRLMTCGDHHWHFVAVGQGRSVQSGGFLPYLINSGLAKLCNLILLIELIKIFRSC